MLGVYATGRRGTTRKAGGVVSRRYRIEAYDNETERFEWTEDAESTREDAETECDRIARETQTSRRVVDTRTNEVIHRVDY